jgi:hypothetical protein
MTFSFMGEWSAVNLLSGFHYMSGSHQYGLSVSTVGIKSADGTA